MHTVFGAPSRAWAHAVRAFAAGVLDPGPLITEDFLVEDAGAAARVTQWSRSAQPGAGARLRVAAREVIIDAGDGATMAIVHDAAGWRLSVEVGDATTSETEATLAVVAAVRLGVSRLSGPDRQVVGAELNLDPEHSHPTLTARQESLAAELRCTAKTVRRRAERAFTSLALVLAADDGPAHVRPAARKHCDDDLRRFWRLLDGSEVDVVCSEIPREELPDYALPGERNYLRYAKFADLDTLMFIRSRLAQLSAGTVVRDFSPSEHHDTDAATMIVVGGPPWNAKYREFLPQLPFHFEPHPLGEDDPLVVPLLGKMSLGPRWTASAQLVDDIGVLTRLTLASGTTVFLLVGCLTAGVLGVARTFLHSDVAAANIAWIDEHVGDDYVVVVVGSRRLGAITDATDITTTGPLLALRRPSSSGSFEVMVDNTARR